MADSVDGALRRAMPRERVAGGSLVEQRERDGWRSAAREPRLPRPLTSFVGRADELATLALIPGSSCELRAATVTATDVVAVFEIEERNVLRVREVSASRRYGLIGP
jgi:hypothetical protein